MDWKMVVVWIFWCSAYGRSDGEYKFRRLWG